MVTADNARRRENELQQMRPASAKCARTRQQIIAPHAFERRPEFLRVFGPNAGKVVVLVSHDLCQALRIADRVALLADGRLCMADVPEQVYASGALDRVFGVRVRRVSVDGGWQYFYE